MSNNLITKSQFSRMAGVNPSTVSRILKTILSGAEVGGRVDLDHPSVKQYLNEKGVDPTTPILKNANPSYKEGKKGRPRRSESSARITANELPQANHTAVGEHEKEDVTQYLEMTVNEVVFRHGTDAQFLEFLKSVKEIELIEERRLKNAQTKGHLISRSVVSDGMIATLDGAFTRMLTDGAKTIAVRAHALVTSGAEVGEIEEFVSKQLSTFIRPTKSKIKRVLSNA